MRMPEIISNNMFAPCGMNCMFCYSHLGMRKYGKHCQGCLNGDEGKPKHCRSCKIKDCAIANSIAYCYQCLQFPCKLIKNLEKSYNKRYNISLIANSIFAREHGLEAFMKIDRDKFLCKKCSGAVSLHDGICSECLSTKDESK